MDGEDNKKTGDAGANGIFINLTVPEGAEAGVDSLTFEYEGAEFDVPIPEGSVPGDVLRIKVGVEGGDAPADDDGRDNDNAGAEANDKGKVDQKKKYGLVMDELGGIDEEEPAADDGNKKRPHSLLSELGMEEAKEDNGTAEERTNCSNVKEITTATSKQITKSVDGVTTVHLGDGLMQQTHDSSVDQQPNCLHLLESLQNSCTDQESAKGENGEGDGTHGMVWASGTVLAQALTSTFGLEFLNKHADGHEKRLVRSLELGSGLGVCGLALARALDTKSNSKQTTTCSCPSVLLTDQGDTAITLLKENIKRNHPYPQNQPIIIEAESLLWGESLLSRHDETIDLILGSDLLYNTHASYDPLIKTMKQYLNPERGVIILGVRWRKPDLERDFFAKAEKEGLRFDLWQEFVQDEDFSKRCPCRLGWREYGNPECDDSNRYFHETTISSIGGAEKTLASLMSEEDMKSMNDQEYAQFEELQVQIYIGRQTITI